jgi:hypothetical protein
MTDNTFGRHNPNNKSSRFGTLRVTAASKGTIPANDKRCSITLVFQANSSPLITFDSTGNDGNSITPITGVVALTLNIWDHGMSIRSPITLDNSAGGATYVLCYIESTLIEEPQ